MAHTDTSAALSAISNVMKLLTEMKNTTPQIDINHTVLAIQSQLIEINSKIISIQGDYEVLAKDKNEIEKQLAKEIEKSNEAGQYELKSLNGHFVYEYKGSEKTGHYICATCHDTKTKSILHRHISDSGNWLECKKNPDHNVYPGDRRREEW